MSEPYQSKPYFGNPKPHEPSTLKGTLIGARKQNLTMVPFIREPYCYILYNGTLLYITLLKGNPIITPYTLNPNPF